MYNNLIGLIKGIEMDKNKLIQVTSLFSDFRDSAADAVQSHMALIAKLAGDASIIADKPEDEWTEEERVIYNYYNENLSSLITDSIKTINSYTEGTDKYISALEQVIEVINKD